MDQGYSNTMHKRDQSSFPCKQTAQGLEFFRHMPLLFSMLLLSVLILSACAGDEPQKKTITGPEQQTLTYSTKAEDVLIRTYYGGGQYGSFSSGPQVSIYGDGTYILGLEQQGQISDDALQQLLNTLVNTHGLLNFQRQQFSDMPDQNMTLLQLTLNDQSISLTYGTFGTQQQNQQDLNEYERLGQALTAINEVLTGELQPYNSQNHALIVRQNFNPILNQLLTPPNLPDIPLDDAAYLTCGDVPDTHNDNPPSPNHETGCMKYTVPEQAILLNANQFQTLQSSLGDANEGTFQVAEDYFTVYLRPLLPDELPHKLLAMFASNQSTYKEIKLHEGSIPVRPVTP